MKFEDVNTGQYFYYRKTIYRRIEIVLSIKYPFTYKYYNAINVKTGKLISVPNNHNVLLLRS